MIALMLGWIVFYYIRFELDIFSIEHVARPQMVLIPSLLIAAFWICIFTFFGLYKRLYLISRFDELVRVGKITIIGTLIFFFLLFTDDLNWTSENISSAKYFALIYWFITFTFVSLNRLTIRTIQRATVQKGMGLHKAIIVGTGAAAKSVHENLIRHRTSGLDVIGFIKPDHSNGNGDQRVIEDEQILGSLNEIRDIIKENKIQDVIVALEQQDRESLIRVLDEIDLPNITVKILPDFFQIISGLNQTNQIFGLPLIEVMPDPMPTWEKFVKRLMDIVLSLAILVITLPVMLIVAIVIKTTSTGPAIYSQERIGLYGRKFMIYKFRSMYNDAEKRTGPTWAKDDDPRITPVGYWLRRLRLDELPQLFNVLRGDMSLVGPRPERQFFVDQFKKQIPLYTRRLRVRPGITGWAQVKWKYDETLDDVKEKTKYDLFYVENMSLKMDLKILINTIFTMLSGKGQ